MTHGNQQLLTSNEAGARTVYIPFKPPYDWEMLIGFLQPRAIPGLESVSSESYKRVFTTGDRAGVLEVRQAPDRGSLTLKVPGVGERNLNRIRLGISRLFDCGADPGPIAEHLSKQPLLKDLVSRRPGVRVPGAFDGFEIAVRAVLGQQVTVRAATTMAGRLVTAFGNKVAPLESPLLTGLFPAAATLAEADLTLIGLTRAKQAAIAGLARAHLSEPLLFEPSNDPRAAVARLIEIPGIGQWTAEYIAMRALKDPDGFPASDLGLLRAVSNISGPIGSKDLENRSKVWRPWRAYAAMYLWTTLG